MKIYTRTGDKGKTTLAGGRPVSKMHIRLEAYGTIDELIAHVAMVADLWNNKEISSFLLYIEDRLMVCASILATDCEDCDVKIPELPDSDVTILESAIDTIEIDLPALKSFVLPGGHIISSQCHIARTVCRRAEREIIRLSAELFVPDVVIKFINRLSDYLFVLSRKALHDFDKKDIPWHPQL